MTKTHVEKKSNRKMADDKKKTIITAIIIILLISALGVYVFKLIETVNNSTDYTEYNKFIFANRDGFWYTTIADANQSYEAIFNNHPLDLVSLYYNDNITDFLLKKSNKGIILAVSPYSNITSVLAGSNIARITGRFYRFPTKSALYIPKDQREAYINETNSSTLMVDCSQAREDIPIIWILPEGNETKVDFSNENPYCIIVESDNAENIAKSGDLLTYKLLGIMP